MFHAQKTNRKLPCLASSSRALTHSLTGPLGISSQVFVEGELARCELGTGAYSNSASRAPIEALRDCSAGAELRLCI